MKNQTRSENLAFVDDQKRRNPRRRATRRHPCVWYRFPDTLQRMAGACKNIVSQLTRPCENAQAIARLKPKVEEALLAELFEIATPAELENST